MKLLELNQQLTTTRQFLAIYAEQEKQLLEQIAEATADADKPTLDAITALGLVKGTPQEVDAVKAKRLVSKDEGQKDA
jgi:hypothetical protein